VAAINHVLSPESIAIQRTDRGLPTLRHPMM
jgi:hypothetical protein